MPSAVFITDVHGRFDRLLRLPAADLLLVGGDLTHFGQPGDVRSFLNIARTRFSRILAVPGNCDPAEAEDVLREAGALAETAGTILPEFGLFVAGLGGSNPTPTRATLYEWEDGEMEQRLAAPVAAPSPDGYGTFRVLLTHAPPAGSGAARLANGGRDAGSRAVAVLAAVRRADLVLCGHLHEACGDFAWDGRRVVNPGPLKEDAFATLEWNGGALGQVVLARLPAIC